MFRSIVRQVRIVTLVCTALIVFVQTGHTQKDSTNQKYGLVGIAFSSGVSYLKLDALRDLPFMLETPKNIHPEFLSGNLYLGNPKGFFGSLEFTICAQTKKGPYRTQYEFYPEIKVQIIHTRMGIYLYRNLLFGKHSAFDVSIGSSLNRFYISSINQYQGRNSHPNFLRSTAKQNGALYFGMAYRHFWSTRTNGDHGMILRLGYHLPTVKTTWSDGYFLNQFTVPDIDINGLTASIGLYIWSYSPSYKIKQLSEQPSKPNWTAEKGTATENTSSLFKNKDYSYMQWDLGYSGFVMKNQYFSGFDASPLGFVFRKKYATGIGISGFSVQSLKDYESTPPPMKRHLSIYWNNELLLHPDRTINFSFPLRIGLASSVSLDTIPPGHYRIGNVYNAPNNVIYYHHLGKYFNMSAGANVFVNVFPGLSIGAGANYRMAFDVPRRLGTEKDFSGITIQAFLRIKLDTRQHTINKAKIQAEYLRTKNMGE